MIFCLISDFLVVSSVVLLPVIVSISNCVLSYIQALTVLVVCWLVRFTGCRGADTVASVKVSTAVVTTR